jgi:hypothetical protein
MKQKVMADSATLISPRWDWEFHCLADGTQSKGIGGLIAHFIDTGRPGEKPLHGQKSLMHSKHSMRARAIRPQHRPAGSS